MYIMESFLEPLKEFSKNSVRLVKRCTKPDRKGAMIGHFPLYFKCGKRFCPPKPGKKESSQQAYIEFQLSLSFVALQNSTRSAFRQRWGLSSWASSVSSLSWCSS